jgi:TctA family transporter
MPDRVHDLALANSLIGIAQGLTDTLDLTFDKPADRLASGTDIVRGCLGGVAGILDRFLPGITDIVRGCLGGVAGILDRFLPGITDIVRGRLGGVAGILDRFLPGITDIVRGRLGGVAGILDCFLPGITDVLDSLDGRVDDSLKEPASGGR